MKSEAPLLDSMDLSITLEAICGFLKYMYLTIGTDFCNIYYFDIFIKFKPKTSL